jgi:hypothetical protein
MLFSNDKLSLLKVLAEREDGDSSSGDGRARCALLLGQAKHGGLFARTAAHENIPTVGCR